MLNANMAEAVQTSPFALDQQHMAFHEECVEHEYGMRDAQPQVIMAPERVAQAMGWPDPPADAVNFQRRELISRHWRGFGAARRGCRWA